MPSCRGRSPLTTLSTGPYLSLPRRGTGRLALPWLVLCALGFGGAASARLPTVASINLCTDQLVLSVADPEQILSLSWLASHPEESMLAAAASRYPVNYGSAEELLLIDADVIIAGSETSPFTRQLLERLGATIVVVEPATSLADVARNLEQVGTAVGRPAAAREAATALQSRAAALAARRAAPPRSAVVVRPGGFTIGRDTLAFELLALAGLDNAIAELDRWGSLSIETLIVESPEVLVMVRYRDDEASLANRFFRHPALATLAASQQTVAVHSRYFACGVPASLDATAALLDQLARR